MSQMLDARLPEHLAARRKARRREYLTQVVAAVIAVVCFVAAGFLVRPINAIRKERELVIDPTSIKGLPPDIALLGKLGTFRALAIDWASIRGERLKEQGKHYEAYQLHMTVCRLQPRFPTVWAIAAWNMAYNISVTQYTPEARWQWVSNGIKLIRDEGLVYNPKSVTLYKELAWIYWHKIGDFMDDEHLNYKRALAVEMERVLGEPPVAITVQDYFDWFAEIVEANRNLKALIDEDTDIERLVTKLDAVGLKPDELLLEFVARHLRTDVRAADLRRLRAAPDSLDAQRLTLLRDPAEAPTLDRLLAAIRSKVLRERMKFDLDWMQTLMVEMYGPLDWRSPFAHTLYWASLGNRESKSRELQNAADSMNTARLVFMALQGLLTRGKMALAPDFDRPFDSYVDFSPDTRFIPFMDQTYRRLAAEQFSNREGFAEFGIKVTNYWVGYVSALHDWIELLYFEGGEQNAELARKYYVYLRENNPNPDGSVQAMYTDTVEEFVLGNIRGQMGTFRQANGIIRTFVAKSLKELSLGKRTASLKSLEAAADCYEFWMRDTTVDLNDRRLMQPLAIVRRDMIEAFMQEPRYAPLAKVRLWRQLDLRFQRLTYRHLRPYFSALCDAIDPPWDVAVAFAEPPGWEDVEDLEAGLRGAGRREGVEQGERSKSP